MFELSSYPLAKTNSASQIGTSSMPATNMIRGVFSPIGQKLGVIHLVDSKKKKTSLFMTVLTCVDMFNILFEKTYI